MLPMPAMPAMPAMLRRGLLALLLVAGGLLVNAAPAQAIGSGLQVTAYYDSSSRTNLVGQSWFGCNRPPGSWGVQTPYRNWYSPPC
jgi:hypothetical protein